MPIKSETFELVAALAQRPEWVELARAAFRQAYPEAPEAMIGAATFHVAADGIDAAFNWLAAVETFFRNPQQKLDEGSTWHLIYHLYNWNQLESLLPAGRTGMIEWLQEAQEYLAEGDTECAGRALRQIEAMITGDLQPPKLE